MRSKTFNLIKFAFGFFLWVTAACLQVQAGEPRLVEMLRDPLHPGNTINWTNTGQWISSDEFFATQFQFAHTWSETVATGITVPIFWYDPYGPAGSRTPRVGGGPYERIFLNFTNRAIGDAQSYLNFDVVVAFPYQSDPLYQNTVNASWLFGATVTGHYLFANHFAGEVTLSDADGFPALIHDPKTNQYKDSSNQVSWIAQLFYYASNRLDFRLTYQEMPPYASQTGTDNASQTFIGKTSLSLRQRLFGLGLDFALKKYLLLSLDGYYYDQASVANQGGTKWNARIKWVF